MSKFRKNIIEGEFNCRSAGRILAAPLPDYGSGCDFSTEGGSGSQISPAIFQVSSLIVVNLLCCTSFTTLSCPNICPFMVIYTPGANV